TAANSYANAFFFWVSARDYLRQAFQGFFDACRSLDNARVEQFAYRLNPHTRKVMSDQIDEEILFYASLRDSIDSVKDALLFNRSNCSALVPINRLPVEVLGNVFKLAQRYCVHDIIVQRPPQTYVPDFADSISMVCTNWRKVALNTRELWSHIDLATNIDHAYFDPLYNRARLWLERSRGYPLSIHMHEFREGDETDHEELETLLSWNLQYMTSVHIWSDSAYPFEDFPWELLGWRIYGSQARIQEICIDSQNSLAGPVTLPHEHFGPLSFFDSVSVLHLRGAAVPWDIQMCRNLTELRLEGLSEATPSLIQLASILRASPRLRSLAICEMGLQLDQTFDDTPIILPDLEVLNLSSLVPECLRSILPLLVPGPKPLRMSIALPSGERFEECVGAFFKRSNITALFVDYWYSTAWCPLPNSIRESLQVLGVTLCNFLSEEDPHIISAGTSTPMSHESTICPKLRTLHLLSSSLSPKLLLSLITSHSIKEISLSECTIRSNYWESEAQGYSRPSNIQELAELIPETVQSIRVADSYDDDLASRWEFVM
ncbi:hypothetical protein FRC07_008572, partial [Ceratobasidium sp. 392]